MAKQREAKTQEEALEFLVTLLPEGTDIEVAKKMGVKKTAKSKTTELSFASTCYWWGACGSGRSCVAAHAEGASPAELVKNTLEKFRAKAVEESAEIDGWETMPEADPGTGMIVASRRPVRQARRPVAPPPRLTNSQVRLTFKG